MSGIAVFVPGSPLLLPEVGGSSDPGRELREQAVHAVRAAITEEVRVEIVVASDQAGNDVTAPFPLTRLIGTATSARAGALRTDVPGPPAGEHTEPVAVAVARVVLAGAGWSGPIRVRPVSDHDHDHDHDHDRDQRRESGPSDDADPVLIMVGDGSALRRDGGPDVARQDALEFDAALLTAIAHGDAEALRRLSADPSDAASLFVTGAPVWAELARTIPAGTPITASVDYSGDPFGVFTVIALWRW